MKKILVLTDNEVLFKRFNELINSLELTKKIGFDFKFSYFNNSFKQKFKNSKDFAPINIKQNVDEIIDRYNLIFSLHSKQIFPEKLVKSIKCINVHPGYNPYNRGWYPQVFSIINHLPVGATIHEMDELLDHGPIICQKKVDINLWDTSLTVYERILETEIELLKKCLIPIINGEYTTTLPESEGNLNLKKDFENICKINLDDKDTFLNHINKLRALTHGKFKNAFFIDPKTNKKVYVSINLTLENKNG